MKKHRVSGINWSVIAGIAFVCFTTQYGGGFASGAQLKSYFIKFGIWCLIMPLISQAILAVYHWYGLRYAYNHKLYDFGSFNKSMYGKYQGIFSVLYDINYLGIVALVPAVAFSSGASALNQLTGCPYIVATIAIAVFMFVITIYGTWMIQKTSKIISILIVLGCLAIFIPNIVLYSGNLGTNIGVLAAEKAPIGPALYSAVIYACFQCAAPALSQHTKFMTNSKQAKQSMILGFVVNSAMIMLAILGILTIIDKPDYAVNSMPVMVILNEGFGGVVLKAILTILIILGAVSTAVNQISAMTLRIMKRFFAKDYVDGKPTKQSVLIAGILTIVALCISQFGLVALVSKGFSYLAYLAIPTVMIPFPILAVMRWKSEKELAAKRDAEEAELLEKSTTAE